MQDTFLYVGSKLNYNNQQKVSAPNLCQLFGKQHVNPQAPDPLLWYSYIYMESFFNYMYLESP